MKNPPDDELPKLSNWETLNEKGYYFFSGDLADEFPATGEEPSCASSALGH